MLTIASRIQIPLFPVPVTLQTLALLLLPLLFGTRMALISLFFYITLGFLGAPVFAGGAGPLYMLGATGGYLAGFAASLLFMGAGLKILNKLQQASMKFLALTAIMLIAHAIIIFCGTFWLAYGVPQLGLDKAILVGTTPFIIGSIVKSLAASAFGLWWLTRK